MAENYLDLARQAYEASTNFLQANWRKDFDYSLRAFRNEHAPDSKYSSPEYASRSRIFHPKTRSIIRKNEAAAMQAAFSGRQMVNAEAANPDSQYSVAAAEALKEVMQYRLSRTLSTFELYIGGVQDAQTTGAVVSYQYWEYEKRGDKKLKDRPCIELRPIENLRFDAGADWLDVVNTSPYWCDIIPMFVCDVRAMMNNENDKTGEPKWKKYKDEEIAAARPEDMESTRRARAGGFQLPEEQKTGITAFDIVWVMRWFMRDSQGDDMTYYTLGTQGMLTDAKPIDEVYFHGVRPYVMGYAILETHRPHKTSMPVLIKPLQQAINQVGNQRFDNVQLVLNKRYYVARGRQTDTGSLVRNIAGGITLTSNPETDIKEANWPDVTSSSYVEHDRFNSEVSDLAGDFSPSTKVANNAVNDTLGGSRMAAAGAGLMSEYLLETINHTWWTRVLRQLALLEQHYETDEIVLGVCATKAKLFPRFGISQISDDLLSQEVLINVDMAMGDPMQRFQKFLLAIKSCIEVISTAPPGMNVKEICHEIMSNAGYRDGTRFIDEQQDPRLLKAMQMLQQMKAHLEGKQMELQAAAQIEQDKTQSAEKQKLAQLMIDDKRISGDLALRNKELDIVAANHHNTAFLKRAEIMKSEPVAPAEPVDPAMRQVELADKLAAVDLKEAQALKARADAGISNAEKDKTVAETQAAMVPVLENNDVAQRLDQVAQAVASIDISGAVAPIAGNVADLQGRLHEMNRGLGALAGFVLNPKASPKGFKLVKPDGKKTTSVVIEYDDGTKHEMNVQ